MNFIERLVEEILRLAIWRPVPQGLGYSEHDPRDAWDAWIGAHPVRVKHDGIVEMVTDIHVLVRDGGAGRKPTGQISISGVVLPFTDALAVMALRDVRGMNAASLVFPPPTTSSHPATGRNDLHLNAAWLREFGAKFSGRWVALRDGVLLAWGETHSACLRVLRGRADVINGEVVVDSVTFHKVGD